MAQSDENPTVDGIDMDRVIVDPDYRRRVIAHLRAEAAVRPPSGPAETSPSPGNDD
jgi:hypothetical protein